MKRRKNLPKVSVGVTHFYFRDTDNNNIYTAMAKATVITLIVAIILGFLYSKSDVANSKSNVHNQKVAYGDGI